MFTEDPIPLRDLISKVYNSEKYIGFKKKMGLKLCSEITYLTYLILVVIHAPIYILHKSFYYPLRNI